RPEILRNDNAVNSERWREIERLYHSALERPPRDREAFLESECPNDESLRLEVLALLNDEASADDFLEEPAPRIAAQLMTGPPAVSCYRVRRRRYAPGLGKRKTQLAPDGRVADRRRRWARGSAPGRHFASRHQAREHSDYEERLRQIGGFRFGEASRARDIR